MTGNPPARASLAARYRPRCFADLVGQQHVVGVLSRAVSQGTVPQQLLFAGGSGLGKTTVARITAAALLCERPVELDGGGADACTACPSCQDVFSLDGPGHPDVVEIDAASHGGKDEIRALAERAALAPTRGGVKVYIIDEAHALSGAGGSALLKLLEEPPAHVVFMLASTDPHKILKTNRGRCTEFTLLRPGTDLLAGNLQRVAAAEGWDLPDDVARLVISSTDPDLGVRGTLMTLEKLSAGQASGVIDLAAARALLGRDTGNELAAALHAGDLHQALAAADAALSRAGEAAVRAELADHARQQLLTAEPLQAPGAAARLARVLRCPSGPAGALLAVAALLDVDLASTRPNPAHPTANPNPANAEGHTGRRTTGSAAGQSPDRSRAHSPEPAQPEPAPSAAAPSAESVPHGSRDSAADPMPPVGAETTDDDWVPPEEPGDLDYDGAPTDESTAPVAVVHDPQQAAAARERLARELAGADPFDDFDVIDTEKLQQVQEVQTSHGAAGTQRPTEPDAEQPPGATSAAPEVSVQQVPASPPAGTPDAAGPAGRPRTRKPLVATDPARGATGGTTFGAGAETVGGAAGPSADAVADAPLARAFLTVLIASHPDVARSIANSGLHVTATPGVVVFTGTREALAVLRAAAVNTACRSAAGQLGVRLKSQLAS